MMMRSNVLLQKTRVYNEVNHHKMTLFREAPSAGGSLAALFGMTTTAEVMHEVRGRRRCRLTVSV